MQWSMPPRVLQLVAGLIGLVALTAFVLGIVNAPSKARLPGEKVSGEANGVALDATDATPLSQERIEGPPPAVPLTDEQKEKLAADKEAKAEADAATKLLNVPPAAGAPAATGPASPGPDRVGDLLKAAPPPEEPPH